MCDIISYVYKHKYIFVINYLQVSFIFSYSFIIFYHKYYQLIGVAFSIELVIRASVPKLTLDAAFEQKNEIAKAVEDELEKVDYLID